MMQPYGSVRVEVVPDNDEEVRPEIPKDVLVILGPDDVLMAKTGHMMYVRSSLWERIKHRFQYHV